MKIAIIIVLFIIGIAVLVALVHAITTESKNGIGAVLGEMLETLADIFSGIGHWS